MAIWTAFLMGLLGSFHCVGMCGPIALALPAKRNISFSLIADRVTYNGGRVVTYTIMGLLFGVLGSGLNLAGFQQVFSIAAGVLILILALFSLNLESKFNRLAPVAKFNARIRSALSNQMRRKGTGNSFLIGFFNGFLPCGFVYLALAGAVSSGGIFQGAGYMAAFGAGTFPVMFAMSMAGGFINLKARRRMASLVPVFMVIFGVLFILRGLDLGIPFLSPDMSPGLSEAQQGQSCH